MSIVCFAHPISSFQHFQHFGKLAARTLRAPLGSTLSSQIQLYTAFLLSAFIHGLGDLSLGSPSSSSSYLGRSIPFFVLNALAISLEDLVLAVLRRTPAARLRGTKVGRAAGYVWVAGWVSVLAPTYVFLLFEAGVVMEPVLPWSPTRMYVLPWM